MINLYHRKRILLILIIFIFYLPASFSHGGCVKVAGDVFVQFSAAPITPNANEQVSFLISFGNNNGFLNERVNGTLRIIKDGNMIFEKKFDERGILSLKYAFEDAGFYEMYVDFVMNGKEYHPEDFTIEVVDGRENTAQNIILSNIFFLIAGIALGCGLVLTAKKFSKK